MKDSYTDSNAADFKQRYQGTFCWYLNPEGNGRLLVRIDSVNSGEVRFTDIYSRSLAAARNSGVEFEFSPVERGWHTTTDGTLFLTERIPARQWKRGICEDNTALFSFNKGMLVGLPVRDYLFKFYCNLDTKNEHKEARALANRGAVINRHFAISPGNVFMFYSKQEGTFNPDKKEIVLSNKMILPEVKDALRRENLNFSVRTE